MIPSNLDTVQRTIRRLELLGASHIVVGDSVFRRFECVDGCSACCVELHNTLDFLPRERAWGQLKDEQQILFIPRIVKYGNLDVTVMTTQNDEGACMFLTRVRPHGGLGCTFWPDSPIECAASVEIDIHSMHDKTYVTKQGFHRAWRFKIPPQCRFYPAPVSDMSLDLAIRVFERYAEWAHAFQIRTYIEDILERLADVYHGACAPGRFEIIH